MVNKNNFFVFVNNKNEKFLGRIVNDFDNKYILNIGSLLYPEYKTFFKDEILNKIPFKEIITHSDSVYVAVNLDTGQILDINKKEFSIYHFYEEKVMFLNILNGVEIDSSVYFNQEQICSSFDFFKNIIKADTDNYKIFIINIKDDYPLEKKNIEKIMEKKGFVNINIWGNTINTKYLSQKNITWLKEKKACYEVNTNTIILKHHLKEIINNKSAGFIIGDIKDTFQFDSHSLSKNVVFLDIDDLSFDLKTENPSKKEPAFVNVESLSYFNINRFSMKLDLLIDKYNINIDNSIKKHYSYKEDFIKNIEMYIDKISKNEVFSDCFSLNEEREG